MIVDPSLSNGRSVCPCSATSDEFCLIITHLRVDAIMRVSVKTTIVSAFQQQLVNSPSKAIFPRNNNAAAMFVVNIHAVVESLV